ncbi:MAG: hypothetical protein RR415_07140 [Ruthenibacterium sp.]
MGFKSLQIPLACAQPYEVRPEPPPCLKRKIAYSFIRRNNMIKNHASAVQLNDIISSVVDNESFNFIKDLKILQKNFKKFKTKDFEKIFEKIISKYESAEAVQASSIRVALVKKCRAGDVNAIRLYKELQQKDSGGDEVVILDDIN